MALYDEIDPDLIVYLPSGTPFPTLNTSEADFLIRLTEGYTEMRFQHASDLSELDRLLQNELLAFRYNTWLILGEDYKGNKLDPRLQTLAKDLSLEIRQIKTKLGIDKSARDKARGEGSVPQRMTSLLARARRFELHRCEQVDKALELQNQLIALVTLHFNTAEHPEQQRKMRVTADDIVAWCRDVLAVEFTAIDEHWRTHEQHIWHMEDARLAAQA